MWQLFKNKKGSEDSAGFQDGEQESKVQSLQRACFIFETNTHRCHLWLASRGACSRTK